MNDATHIPISKDHMRRSADLARQCSSTAARERALVSQSAAWAARDHLGHEFNLVFGDGRSARPAFIELLDFCDFSFGGWLIEMRAALTSEQSVLNIPTMPLMVGVLSDFYLCAEVDRNLSSVKVFGFARRSDLASAELSANGLFALFPAEELLPVERLPELLREARPVDTSELRLFDEWQARAARIIKGVGEVIAAEGMFSPDQLQSIVAGLRDDVWRIYGGKLPTTGLEPLFNRLFRRFGIATPVPAPPASPLVFNNSVEQQNTAIASETRKEFFQDELSVGERVALYRHLLADETALTDHRRLRRALDHATGGKNLASPQRRERMKSAKKRRLASASIDTPTRDEVAERLAEIAEQDDDSMIASVIREMNEPALDFAASPEAVRLVAEAEQISFGHLFSPAFGTEISLVDPLPHQRLAVYEHMLNQSRLRFLLADDAGAGKTIMTGLYIREMLSRRLVRRVLIVPPAGLLGNWESEMNTLFGLPFRVATGNEAKKANPFLSTDESDSDLLIVSVDTLAGERMFARLQDPEVEPYDLVVFDEAHKLAADREQDYTWRKTDRYRLAETLAGASAGEERWDLGWGCRHLLLLTATPHMGKDIPYYCLWRLLQPEALSTFEAFKNYPAEARARHFLRRTKEEMVNFQGDRIYPTRITDTLSYDLTQGSVSEQALYDETTSYIRTYYSRARILNRSAARLAMSVFQRRLASSTYAVLRSFERRLENLNGLISLIESGQITAEKLEERQRQLNSETRDLLEEETADEEDFSDGREEHEVQEEQSLHGVVAVSLADLIIERDQVKKLLDLARQVDAAGQESKFDRLRETLKDPRYRDEKMIIFTEHRDTLDYLTRRLSGIGFSDQIAQIHGGMDYLKRQDQVEFFRKPVAEGGAKFLVATDAAGEGINLQFCWLMINYDIPWNPARLEQRMGRIHRYKQKHDPVVIINLVAGSTREGRVLRTLLEKLERIRKDLGSDKVFDVIGRLFEGVSIKDYLENAVTDEGAEDAVNKIEGKLTKEQIEALRERERRLYGDGGDVKRELPRLTECLELEQYRRLLPGYVRHFIEKAAPQLGLELSGDLDSYFALNPTPDAPEILTELLEVLPPEMRDKLTVHRPNGDAEAVFVHPGGAIYETLRGSVVARFAEDALRGATFVDPAAKRPYLFHLALLAINRQSDPQYRELARTEAIEYRLVGLKQEEGGVLELCPAGQLLLLKGGQGLAPSAINLVASARESVETARRYVNERLAPEFVEKHRQMLNESLPARVEFIHRGFGYQEAELAAARTKLRDKANAGSKGAKAELTKVKERQSRLKDRREEAIAVLQREPELISAAEVTFLAHALVVPSHDPEDQKRHDAQVEAIAVRVARAYEESLGAVVQDVSTPAAALAAGLEERPGFDLLSTRSDAQRLCIEVKGRAGVGDIELTENEWVKACNLREQYWLYVVFDCASAQPRLLRVQDPFHKLLFRAKGGVVIDEQEIFNSAT